MKILHAFNQDLNPYVEVIQHGLRENGIEVVSQTTPFWQGKAKEYDLLHIQWPETLFDWRGPSDVELIFLKQRLAELKGRVPVVFTYHNEQSNHRRPENQHRLEDLYRTVMTCADAVVHLGESSKSQLIEQGISAKHAVIPIPVYEKLYADYLNYTKLEARKKLGLPENKKILLCFGNFRNCDEYELVVDAQNRMQKQKYLIDAPKWFKPRDIGFSPLQPFFCLRSLKKVFQTKRLGIQAGSLKTMSDEQVALHFAACDVVFIQRTQQLNSGNLPMGFLFKKVVIGPDTGNIGSWLRECNNPVFDYTDSNDVARVLTAGIKLAASGKGEENHRFAMGEWNTKKIGEAHARLYRDLIKSG